MGLLSLEHSRAMYRADLFLYGTLVIVLLIFLLAASPRALALQLVSLAVVGLASWTVIEYALHRFVLHGMPPFRRWHAQHHRRPSALIGAPTLMSSLLIAMLVFIPSLALAGPWRACALTLGVSVGYLVYALTHHALHHWHADNAWLQRRKRWHAQHHHVAPAVCYGVTTSFWDALFGTAGAPRLPTRERLTLHRREQTTPVVRFPTRADSADPAEGVPPRVAESLS